MRSLSLRSLFCFAAILISVPAFAHDVTITGTQTFASLDGSSADHDGVANGVFTVSDGNLVVNGVVNCNDDSSTSACPMAFAVSGSMTVNAGGALYAENRSGSGTGGAITLTVGGSLAMNGNAIVSTASGTSSGSTGGAITANVTGTVTIASGSTIDSGATNAKGGDINITAGGVISVDGNVLSGPSRTILSTRHTGVALSGGTANQIGGAIRIGSSTFAEPALLVGTSANIISQGENDGAGPVTLDACGIQVRGLVAALSRKDSAANVIIRSGKDVLVDGRDLAAAGARMGRVRADAPTGSAVNKGVDIFAKETVDLFGPGGSLYLITSIPGLHDAKSYGGQIRIISLEDAVNGSGNLIDDGHTASGDTGGTVSIAAKGNVTLATAVIRAEGDFNTGNNNRGGGTISIRSHSGNVVWTSGIGDVRPVGSSSGLPPADQGKIFLTACGTVNTTGTSFPTNGTPTGVFPVIVTGSCSPAAPSLPSGVPVLVTCNTPPVANDTAATTNEDTTVTITLSGSDADGDSLTFSIVSGPSNGSLGAVISTGPTTATVDYTPNLNYNGSDSFVFRANDGNGGTDDATASIVIVPVNDPPTFLAGPTVTVLEDSGPQTISNWVTAISPGPADESGQAVTFTVTNDNNALFSSQPVVAPNGTLMFTPAANAYGSATITIVAQDNGGIANGGDDTSNPQTSTITVTPVNDEPSFVAGANQTVNEDAGPQTVSGWATAISAGPNEGSQALTFVTSTPQSSLFSTQPAVDASGTLTYTPAANANGIANVSVYLTDDGGTANSGDDTSPAQTFTITINAVNDEPSFTSGGDVTVLEDSAAYSAAWATDISAGPADESGQTVTFTTTNDNNALFAIQPSISAGGVLTFTPASHAYGSATVTVTLSDNGGILNGGDDTSPAQTFVLTVTPVNDEPSFNSGGNVAVNEDSGAYSAPWATGISAGPNEGSQTVTFVTTNDNNALFAAQPSVSASGVLTFTPAADAFGTATVTVYLTDDGGIDDGGDDTSPSQTFVVTVNSVNDAPSFVSGGNVTVSEDSGAYSAAWATGISAGPANESSQTVTFNTTNNNNALFSVQPSVSSAGVLSFTPNANTTGSATVTIFAQDDGGISNGGVDVSATQTFTITVSDVNDEPTFTPGGDQTSNEDAGPQSVVWATSISAGPPSESGQTVTFFVSNDNNALFSAQPSIDSTGTLTYTANPNANDSAIVTVYAQDNGGIAGGGDDTSATYTFTITVVAVNDAPSFTGGGDATVIEDSGAYSAAWATAISAGPPDEAGQTLTFNVTSNSNPSLFTSGPSISSTGVLSFTPAANAFGSATITINLQDNGGGADTSANYTFTITVNAVNDAPSFTPGGDVTVSEDSGPYSRPWATSISAGPANESGQAVTFNVSNNNNALFLVQPSISSTGVLTFTTSLNASGSAIVTVSLQDNGGIANGGVDTSASVQFTITVTPGNDGPTAGNDSWETLGNTELRVDLAGGLTPKIADTTPSGNGVRDNDSDPDGDPFFVTGIVGCSDVTSPFDCTLGDGSKVSMLANGSFSYTPGPGNTTGSFQYTVTDVPAFGAPASSIGTVTITIHDMIWYVNGSAAAGGNGTSIAPFNSFATLNGVGDVDDPGDTIFVHTSAVTGSIAMEASQKLWGEGVGLATNLNLNGNGSPQVLVAPGVKPSVLSGGDTVTVSGVTLVDIAGLALTSSSGNGIDVTSFGASPATSAAIHDNTILGAAQEGIDVNAGSAAGTAVAVSNTSITSSGNGFDVDGAGGAVVSFTNGTIQSTSGTGIRMDGTVSGGNLTVAGLANVTITGFTAAGGIAITAAKFDSVPGGAFNVVNAGTVTVGSSGNPVGAAGVTLSNVSGDLAFGTLTVFGGTSGVTIAGSGLFTGAAGMRVSNTGGSISAPAGVGLSVSNASIGAANMNFTSISAAGGANGILLSNTGTSGGLTVTGTGSAGSGGTIQNTTSDGVKLSSTQNVSLSYLNITNAASGATNAACNFVSVSALCEAGVEMLNAANVSLDDVVIDNNGGGMIGVAGFAVNGLTITDSSIQEIGNTDNESGILLHGLTGTVLFEDVVVTDVREFPIRIYQPAGTGNLSATLRRVALQNNVGSLNGEDGLSVRVEGGVSTFLIDDSDFLNTAGSGIGATAQGVSGTALNMTIQDSNWNENRQLPHALTFATANAAAGRLRLSGSNVMVGCAVATQCNGAIDLDASGTSTLDATIDGVQSTSSGNGTGLEFIVNDNAQGKATINNNSFSMQPNRIGMNFAARAVSTPGSTGRLDLTLATNTINGITSAVSAGMVFQSGASTGTHAQTVCVNATTLSGAGNNIVNGASGLAYTLRQRTGTMFRLQGLAVPGTVEANVENFVQTNNPGGTRLGSTDVASAGGTTIVNYSAATCNTPVAPPLP